MLKKLKQYKFIILVFFISLISTLGFLHDGFPNTDDGNWMIIRLSAFFESLKAGQIPVRFLLRLNNGYGYPVSDFLYPLYLYLGSIIHILGFNFINSIKIIFSLSLITTSIFSFLWLSKKFSSFPALIGSLALTFSPYLLLDVYKRGSIGEVLAISIISFILWQIERKSIILVSLGIALLILAHNSLALFFILFLFLYIFLEKSLGIKNYLVSLMFGFLISAFFWLPAIYDLQYTVFNSTVVSDFYNHFVETEVYSFIFIILILFVSNTYLIFKNKKKNYFLLISVNLNILIVFLNMSVSRLIWEIIPFKNLIQFPFRLMSIFIILFSYQIAYLVENFFKNKKLIIAVFILALSLVNVAVFLSGVKYDYYPESFYSTNLATTTVKNEYMPKWVKTLPTNFPYERVYINGNEKINLISVSDKKIKFQVYLNSAKAVYVNVIYFPGWQAYINGKKGSINYNNSGGLISVNLERGKNEVLIVFEETPFRIFADFLSIMGLLGLGAVIFLQKYNKKNK